MANMALCFLLAAHVALTLGDPSDEAYYFCEYECRVYDRQYEDCAEQEGCYEAEDNHGDYMPCFVNCHRKTELCSQLCLKDYGDIKATCRDECENSTKCLCLHREFIGRFGYLLPDLLSQNVLTSTNATEDDESKYGDDETSDIYGSEYATDADDSKDDKDSDSSNVDSESSERSDDSKDDADDDKKKRSDSSESNDNDESDDSNAEDGPDDPDDADDAKKKRSDSSESKVNDESNDSDDSNKDDGPDDPDDADDESPY